MCFFEKFPLHSWLLLMSLKSMLTFSWKKRIVTSSFVKFRKNRKNWLYFFRMFKNSPVFLYVGKLLLLAELEKNYFFKIFFPFLDFKIGCYFIVIILETFKILSFFFRMLVAKIKFDHYGGITIRALKHWYLLLMLLIAIVLMKHDKNYIGSLMIVKCAMPLSLYSRINKT